MDSAILRRLLLASALATPLGTAAVPAAAQTIPSPYRFVEESQEAGFFAGWARPGRGQFDLGPGPGPVLGGRYAITVGGPFSIEGVVSALPTTRRVMEPDTSLVDDLRFLGESDALLTSVEARLKFTLVGERTWNGLAPFALVGGGVAFDLEGEGPVDQQLAVDDRFEFGTSFLGTLGAGTRWIPREGFVVRMDGLLRLWKLETPRGFRTTDRFPDAASDEWVSSLSLSGGLAILF